MDSSAYSFEIRGVLPSLPLLVAMMLLSIRPRFPVSLGPVLLYSSDSGSFLPFSIFFIFLDRFMLLKEEHSKHFRQNLGHPYFSSYFHIPQELWSYSFSVSNSFECCEWIFFIHINSFSDFRLYNIIKSVAIVLRYISCV